MKLTCLIIAVVVCVFASCKKDVLVFPEPVSPQTDSTLQIGSFNNVVLKTYNVELVGVYYDDPLTFEIDVNNDNSPDFRFSSERWGSPGMGIHPRTKLSCLNENSMLYGQIKTDSTFTFMGVDTYITDSTVTIYNRQHFACNQVTPAYTLSAVSEPMFRIIPRSFNDLLKVSDYFKMDTVTLIDEASSILNFGEIHNDTTTYNENVYDNYCSYLNPGGIYYIGIKMIQGNGPKLGWIKLSVSANKDPTIIESVVQQ